MIDGFQSALSLEILATVDFVKETKKVTRQEDIITSIHNWSDRKRKLFSEKYILIAVEHLNEYSRQLQLAIA